MHTIEMQNKVVIYQPLAVRSSIVVDALCTAVGGVTVTHAKGCWVSGTDATMVEPVGVIVAWWPDHKRDAVEEVVDREVRRMLDAGELAVMVEWHLKGRTARAELHSWEALK